MRHASILLVDDDPTHAGRVVQHLKCHRHIVRVCDSVQELKQILRESKQTWNLIILNVTKTPWNCLTTVQNINNWYRDDLGRRPEVLCLSSVYRGPQLRLDLLRLGARVIYEQ